jgi:hypothetical protein
VAGAVCSKASSSAVRRTRRRRRRGGSAFVLVVKVRGFEPLASSVRVRTSPPLCRPVFMQVDPTVRGEVRGTDEGVGDGAVDADLYLELRVGGHRVSSCKAGQRDGRTPVGGARPSRWWGAQAANFSAKETTTGAGARPTGPGTRSRSSSNLGRHQPATVRTRVAARWSSCARHRPNRSFCGGGPGS